MSSFRIHIRVLLSSIAVCLLGNLTFAVNADDGIKPASDRPNVLFIFSDDHAVNAISSYGSPLAKVAPTPNIDRIAKEGALFQNSFCANSICGPSRACILTGKHSHKNGFMRNDGNGFDQSQWTFMKELKKANYQSAVIGKWHLKTNPVAFDHWEILPGQGSYYNPVFMQMDGSRKKFEGYATDLTTDKSLAWLKQRDKDKAILFDVPT